MPSSQQTAYIFTKELLRLDFDSFVSKLGIIDVYAPTWGGVLEKLGLDYQYFC